MRKSMRELVVREITNLIVEFGFATVVSLPLAVATIYLLGW